MSLGLTSVLWASSYRGGCACWHSRWAYGDTMGCGLLPNLLLVFWKNSSHMEGRTPGGLVGLVGVGWALGTHTCCWDSEFICPWPQRIYSYRLYLSKCTIFKIDFLKYLFNNSLKAIMINVLHDNVNNIFLWKITVFSKAKNIWWEVGIVLCSFLRFSLVEEGCLLTSAPVLSPGNLLFSRYEAGEGRGF